MHCVRVGNRRAGPKHPVLVKAEPEVPPSLLPQFDGPAMIFNAHSDRSGPAQATQLIRSQQWDGRGRLLLVAAKDLAAPGCASVYGFADPRRRTAVVSIHRLKAPDPRLWRERIAKVAAHELLHLEGRRHCPDPACVMHPVSNLQQLDSRGGELCARCRHPRPRWRAAAAAAALCLVLSFLLDATLQALNRKSTPFSWRRQSGGVEVLYRNAPVLLLPAESEARWAAQALNRLFADLDPAPLTLRQQGYAVFVEAGGQVILRLDERMSGGQDPLGFAQGWVLKMNPLLQGKGTASEGCPDCHTFRRDEVLEASMQRTRFWR